MNLHFKPQDRPWYREPWVWFLAAGPLAVIAAGFVTLWLALASEDGLVVDDYYKQGLAINQALGRDRTAAALGLRASVLAGPEPVLSNVEGRVRVILTGSRMPAALRLQLSHPTRRGKDQVVALTAVAAGVYEGRLPAAVRACPEPCRRAGRWRVLLEDAEKSWRLTGEWPTPQEEPLILMAPQRNP